MTRVRDDGLAVCCEACEHQGGAGPQVRRPHLGAREPGHTPHHCVMPLCADVCTHAPKLVDVAEAPLEEVLRHYPDTVCDSEHRDEERLVVGCDPRVRQGGDV